MCISLNFCVDRHIWFLDLSCIQILLKMTVDFNLSMTEEPHELEEYLIYLPPELCELKIVGFSKDIGSSISLLPSIMHRLGNLLVAIELKQQLSSTFPEATEISAHRVRPKKMHMLFLFIKPLQLQCLYCTNSYD
jgi:hypothetical protein